MPFENEEQDLWCASKNFLFPSRPTFFRDKLVVFGVLLDRILYIAPKAVILSGLEWLYS